MGSAACRSIDQGKSGLVLLPIHFTVRLAKRSCDVAQTLNFLKHKRVLL